jgi:hypothetical protein
MSKHRKDVQPDSPSDSGPTYEDYEFDVITHLEHYVVVHKIWGCAWQYDFGCWQPSVADALNEIDYHDKECDKK